jgi:hypothetical protein
VESDEGICGEEESGRIDSDVSLLEEGFSRERLSLGKRYNSMFRIEVIEDAFVDIGMNGGEGNRQRMQYLHAPRG